MTHEEETRNFLRDPAEEDERATNQIEDDWDDEYDGSERYRWDCGDRGWKITCPDDLCHGNDECIHGDPPTKCWTCNRDGSKEDRYY